MTALVSIEFEKDGTTVKIKDDGKGFVIGEDLRFVEAGKSDWRVCKNGLICLAVI